MKDPEDPATLFQMGSWSHPQAWTPPAPEDLSIPGVRIESFAGRGGSGAVYRGLQIGLNRIVAIKILPPDILDQAAVRERFFREAKILASLNHANIVSIYDIGEMADGAPYFVMEWLLGGDFKNRLRKEKISSESAAKSIIAIAEGLEFAHRNGVIHRDLKPGNVLIDEHGHIKLSDFGLAQSTKGAESGSLTMSGTTIGTVDYMAPEQFESGVSATPRTDVYSLGVLSYELLTGKLPRGAFAPASSVANVVPAVDAVIAKALAADPLKRYESAGAFQTAFVSALRRNYHRRIVILAALAVTLFAGFYFYQITREGGVFTEHPITNPTVSQPAPEPLVTGNELLSEAETERPWVPILRLIEPRSHGHLWKVTEKGVESNDERAILRLPVNVGLNYDLRARFTRLSGEHSVAFFLPTASGPLSFELDAWGIGVGGIQNMDGRDMRPSLSTFTAQIENGVEQDVLIEVRSDVIRCFWNDRKVVDQPIEGKEFSINRLWSTATPMLPGVGSWKSPTVFHSIEMRKTNSGQTR